MTTGKKPAIEHKRHVSKYDLEVLRRRTVQFWTSGPVGISFGKTDYSEPPGRRTGDDPRLPRYDYDDVSFIYRQRTSFAEALWLWKALHRRPSNTLNSLHGQAEAKARRDRDRRIEMFVKLRRECADAADRELGPRGLGGAQGAIRKWCAEARTKIAEAARRAEARTRAARAVRGADAKAKIIEATRAASSKTWAELVPLREAVDDVESSLLPLLEAYRSPIEFFQTLGPRIRRDFNLEPGDWQKLAGTLHAWGYAALLNANVREAFDAVAKSPLHFNEMLSRIEQRGVHRDKGRPPGSGDPDTQKEILKQVQARAHEIQRKTGKSWRWSLGRSRSEKAIERRVTPSAIRKSNAAANKTLQ